jgi:CBS domain-containing protein
MSADVGGDVPIHARRVVDVGGDFESQNEVHCHLRKASIPVSECEACPDYAGSEIDLRHHRNYIVCRRLATETASPVALARHIVLHRRVMPHSPPGERTPISEIMCRDVWCAREDLSVAGLRRLLAQRHVGGIPVVAADGRPVGIVTATDLAHPIAGDRRARDVMTGALFVLPDSASISQAAALMALEHVHRIPIVTDDGKLAGIVSSTDVLAWLARQDGYLVPERDS